MSGRRDESPGNYQTRIYLGGAKGERPSLPVRLEALEQLARQRLSPEAYWYVAGGAGEGTMAANLAAFDDYRLVPRMLTDVSRRDLGRSLLGRRLSVPFLLAPVGVQEIVHPEAEVAVARGAKAAGVPMILSTVASRSLEEVAAALGDAPRWFQLYWPNDDALAASLMQRAEAAGYEAIVVTLDTKMMAWRERDLDNAYLPFLSAKGLANYTSDPVFRAALDVPPEADPRATVRHWSNVFAAPGRTWADLERLRRSTRLPILLKGVLHPDDARRAVEAGAEGVVVSNHGGRQVDGSIAALHALGPVAEAVSGRIAVLFDSGVRSGADVLKAIALGADAVLLGRPYVWGLACEGADGVTEVALRLLADIDLSLALTGADALDRLDRTWLAPRFVNSALQN
ncbi:alpha-hydroxy-acid oxidizing protein [Algihabitans albus]|uniref:alpha-hydroxy-acid oxidizing protein n=1 Tax=Algihabitans albus TaxID=2164067 RepID=UPI000E5CC994|nr:alpha-hydroxy-acid oxidizing protein [Algihabitans albus]